NRVVKSQKYEEAAKLRDTEKQLLEELERAKAEWEAETKTKRYVVTDENVAEVVAMMTGIPMQRVNQADSNKLLNMENDLGSRIIGQDDRSEEHTSELQSRENLVCRLLLEKKKTKRMKTRTNTNYRA